jgi:hypothetical protein
MKGALRTFNVRNAPFMTASQDQLQPEVEPQPSHT